MTLDKDKRDGLVAAHPDKKMALVDLKEKIIPVLTSIYGEEDTRPILKALEKIIKAHEPEEERVAPRTELKVGDIYTANYGFENIGATIYDGDVLVVLETGYNLEVGIARSIESAKSRELVNRWTLEKHTLTANCTKYVEPTKETKVPVKKEPVFRRMDQKQFMEALSVH